MFRLKNLLNNISTKLQPSSGSRYQHILDNNLKLYEKFTLVKDNLPYKDLWKTNDTIRQRLKNALDIETNNNDENLLECYNNSSAYNKVIKELHGNVSHPKALRINKEEGDYYIVHVINYTHSPKEIIMNDTTVQVKEMGSYIKGGKEIKHYYVSAVYEIKIKKVDFQEYIRPLTISEKESLGGYENMEKVVESILIDPSKIPIVDMDKYVTDKLVWQAVQYKTYQKLGEIPPSNKSTIVKGDTEL